MSFKLIELEKLAINRANDRHGELENETAAIAWLFANREAHMRNLAKLHAFLHRLPIRKEYLAAFDDPSKIQDFGY